MEEKYFDKKEESEERGQKIIELQLQIDQLTRQISKNVFFF